MARTQEPRARTGSGSERHQQQLHAAANKASGAPVLHAPLLHCFNRRRHVGGDGAHLRVGHQPPRAQDARNLQEGGAQPGAAGLFGTRAPAAGAPRSLHCGLPRKQPREQPQRSPCATAAHPPCSAAASSRAWPPPCQTAGRRRPRRGWRQPAPPRPPPPRLAGRWKLKRARGGTGQRGALPAACACCSACSSVARSSPSPAALNTAASACPTPARTCVPRLLRRVVRREHRHPH